MSSITLPELQEVFRKVFEDPSLHINEHTHAGDISMWDSLTHMELIAGVENTFQVQFTLNEVMDFQNAGDMLSCINRKKEKP